MGVVKGVLGVHVDSGSNASDNGLGPRYSSFVGLKPVFGGQGIRQYVRVHPLKVTLPAGPLRDSSATRSSTSLSYILVLSRFTFKGSGFRV